MGIQKDAGEILVFVYNQYTSGNEWVTNSDILNTTEWEPERINRVINYLKEFNLIKIEISLGNTNGVYNFGIRGLTPSGIHLIENKTEFKRKFEIEVGIPGLFKFSWGASET